MTTVAFIGLGVMGKPMAINLVKAGFDVVGFNRSGAGPDALAAAGGRVASSIAAAVRDSDVIATMLPDSPDVEQVVLGADGVLSAAREGSLLIDLSTIRPQTSRAIAQAGAQRGVRVLDAPVSGGEEGAKAGTLSIMVGGPPEDFDAAQPVLSAMGKTIVRVGAHGSGQTVKAANQLIVAGTIELVAEAIVFLEAHQVDVAPALEVLGGGLAGSTVLSRKGEAMMRHQFAPGFRVELHNKDMGIVTAAARAANVTIPLGAAVAELMKALTAQGKGGLDHSALLTLVEQLSGRGTSVE